MLTDDIEGVKLGEIIYQYEIEDIRRKSHKIDWIDDDDHTSYCERYQIGERQAHEEQLNHPICYNVYENEYDKVQIMTYYEGKIQHDR